MQYTNPSQKQNILIHNLVTYVRVYYITLCMAAITPHQCSSQLI